jgi:hypothetical protein
MRMASWLLITMAVIRWRRRRAANLSELKRLT